MSDVATLLQNSNSQFANIVIMDKSDFENFVSNLISGVSSRFQTVDNKIVNMDKELNKLRVALGRKQMPVQIKDLAKLLDVSQQTIRNLITNKIIDSSIISKSGIIRMDLLKALDEIETKDPKFKNINKVLEIKKNRLIKN